MSAGGRRTRCGRTRPESRKGKEWERARPPGWNWAEVEGWAVGKDWGEEVWAGLG